MGSSVENLPDQLGMRKNITFFNPFPAKTTQMLKMSDAETFGSIFSLFVNIIV